MRAVNVPVGSTFGRLTVTGPAPKGARRLFAVRCECGKDFAVDACHLRSGRTRSCGCLGAERRREAVTKHGHARKGRLSAEYRTWIGIVDRCERPAFVGYADYGGRGIRVCPEWRASFERFLADVGPKPSPRHSIERDDVNGNYEPGNVRWATRREQHRNTRRSMFLIIDGVRAVLTDWTPKSPASQETIRRRVLAGWNHKAAVFTPPRPMRNHAPKVPE